MDTYKFIEDVAEQLTKSISGLSQENKFAQELTKSVLMGIYTQGYRDANMERNPANIEKLDLKEYMNNLKGWGDLFEKKK